MKNRILGTVLLLCTAIIWGSAFVAQSVGMDYVGPLTFNAIRFLIGGIALLPVIFVKDRFIQKKDKKTIRTEWKSIFPMAVICGILLCAGSLLQQYGINCYNMTGDPVGKAGFLTALYIIMVPLFGIFLKKRVHLILWISALLSLVGLYFLCLSESFVFGIGDLLEILGAVAFATHILFLDAKVGSLDGAKVSCVQFMTSGLLCMPGMFLFENPVMSDILACYMPILYAGLFSCGIAYTFQILGQQKVEPALASLIMSLESPISTIAGVILLHDILSGREILGCVIMFAAIILAQVTDFLPKKQKGAKTK